jgi:glucosamine kinase
MSGARPSEGSAVPLALGIDAGASSTRWRLEHPDGQVVAQGRGAALSGHLFTSETQAAARAAIVAMGSEVARHGKPAFVVAGVTGLSIDSEPAKLLQLAFAQVFGLPAGRVDVLDDLRIAYLGAFAPGEGILVYAGTGSIAYHLTSDQTVERSGGHGFLIDDAGAGFWIGQQALRALLRRRDARRVATPLDQALLAPIGGADWPSIRAFAYGGGRQAVASLALVVCDMASQGDGEAATLLAQAGAELARIGQTLIDRLGPLPIALAGGVARAAPLLMEGLRRELGSGLAVRLHAAEPVAAAAALARMATSRT